MATLTAVESHMHDMIALGMGHLIMDVPNEFDPNMNYPVYINEPLVVLALSSLFEKQPWSTRKNWIVSSLRISRNAPSSGFMFEEVMLLVLMEHFGRKFTALGDIFHFSLLSPLILRKVTLVTLRRTAKGIHQCCPVSWNTGSSNCFGFKAKSPAEVIKFLNDLKGKLFLFPDNHMGPDLTCFLQDKWTKEFILVIFQAKLHKDLDVGTWQKELNSVEPEFFYMITVCFSAPKSCHNPSSFISLCCRRMRKDHHMPPWHTHTCQRMLQNFRMQH